MATNDVYELAVRSRYMGQVIVNVFHLMANAGFTPTQAQAQTLADDTKELVRTGQVQNLAYENWTLRQVWGAGVTYHTARPIRTGGLVFEGAHTGTLTGGNTSAAPLPSATALTIKWSTGLVGRRNRGRSYIAALGADSLTSGGNVAAGTITALNAMVDTWRNKYKPGGTDANWDHVLFSFRYASGWAPSPTHPHALTYVGPISTQNEANGVTAYAISNVWRIQRRREVGVGA